MTNIWCSSIFNPFSFQDFQFGHTQLFLYLVLRSIMFFSVLSYFMLEVSCGILHAFTLYLLVVIHCWIREHITQSSKSTFKVSNIYKKIITILKIVF